MKNSAIIPIVKSELSKHTDEIIENIKQMTEKYGIGENLSDTGKGQFGTLMTNANKASSLNEIILFIEYQESKDTIGKSWGRLCSGNKTVAKIIIESLTLTCNELGKNIINSLENRPDNKIVLDKDDIRKIKLIIMEKYLGYLFWSTSVWKSSNNKKKSNNMDKKVRNNV